jgi:hypothetical protein
MIYSASQSFYGNNFLTFWKCQKKYLITAKTWQHDVSWVMETSPEGNVNYKTIRFYSLHIISSLWIGIDYITNFWCLRFTTRKQSSRTFRNTFDSSMKKRWVRTISLRYISFKIQPILFLFGAPGIGKTTVITHLLTKAGYHIKYLSTVQDPANVEGEEFSQ